MHAVYYKKLKILFSELNTQPQLDRHQRSQRTWKMTIAFTALSGSRFWSRHVLLSGPKLQNTNCTDTFSTAFLFLFWPRQLFECLLLSRPSHYLRAWNRLCSVGVIKRKNIQSSLSFLILVSDQL